MSPAALQSLRAQDQTSFFRKGRKDFFVRRHGLSSIGLYKLCLMSIVVLGGAALLVYNHALLGSASCAATGLVLYFFAWQVEKHKKLLETTEFLNALFASVLSAGYKFCMVVAQEDAQIVYLDKAFQAMFPNMVLQPKRMLEALLIAQPSIPEAERNALLQAVEQGIAGEVTVPMQGGDKKTYSIALSVEPIERPSGFCLVRGREL